MNRLAEIMRKDAENILAIYQRSELWETREKSDKSPITAADLASHHYLLNELSALLPGVPFLSEEGVLQSLEERHDWTYSWLIDPLDGTEEFLRRSGEFSVNVALLKGSEPIVGALAVPVRQAVYIGVTHPYVMAKRWRNGQVENLSELQPTNKAPVLAISRRSHPDRVSSFAQSISAQEAYEQVGAAIKFCALAEGQVDVYPRFSPVCEWDVAAGHALIKALGADVYMANGQPFRYNQREVMDSVYFCACRADVAHSVVPAWSEILSKFKMDKDKGIWPYKP